MQFRLFSKAMFVVQWHPLWLMLACLSSGKVVKTEKIFTHEASHEIVQTRISEFKKGFHVDKSLLILPRTEVLMKELVFPLTAGISVNEILHEKLGQLLPYSPREMAWGISLEEIQGREEGYLLAMPEKKVKEILGFLNAVGLEIHEVVTEDQIYLWMLLEKKETGPLLLMDQQEDRLLILFVKEGRLVFSRAFARKQEDPAETCEKISLALLELGEKPSKMLLTGSWNPEDEFQLQKHFVWRGEKWRYGPEGHYADIFHAARLFGKYEWISLLPHQKKMENRLSEKRAGVRRVAASAGLFLGILLLAGMLHAFFETQALESLDREIVQREPGIRELKKIHAVLKKVRDAQGSKENVLSLIQTIGAQAPAPVRLSELRVEGRNFSFKGESPTHQFLSAIVQLLEKSSVINTPKLEATRLRKRLNEDYVEFEVTGKWADRI